MTVYHPAPVVLPEYTDEALTEERDWKGDAAAALLRVPAEYRQTVEAEVTRRARRRTNVGGVSSVHLIADPHETRRQIVAEVLAQLAEVTS